MAEQRIILGDFNARSSSGEISLMKVGYADAWAVGQSLDLDLAYEGNPSGNTRNGRIDYAFYSKQAAHLKPCMPVGRFEILNDWFEYRYQRGHTL